MEPGFIRVSTTPRTRRFHGPWQEPAGCNALSSASAAADPARATPPERLSADLALLPALAERGLCRAGKDISNGGIVGTLAMLCNCSQAGAVLDLDRLPRPDGVPWERWLVSFPSYGYLLAVAPDRLRDVEAHFRDSPVTCREIGAFRENEGIALRLGGTEEALAFPDG